MNPPIAVKTLLACAVFLSVVANANAASNETSSVSVRYGPAPLNPTCYAMKKDSNDRDINGDPKPSHLDVQFSSPLSAGGTVTFDLSNSTVPSGEMEISAPQMHPDFVLISKTDTSFTYTVPNRPNVEYNTKFTLKDAKCFESGAEQRVSLPIK